MRHDGLLEEHLNASPEATMAAYEAAAAAHDLDATLALIHDDAVYWFSNETSYVGKAAVADALRANFDAIVAETYRIDGLQWLVKTDLVAVCVYRYRWSGTIGGRPAEGSGRGTNVLCRTEGWLVVHEHLSRGPAGVGG